MTTTPTAIVVRTAGTNCDAELVRAFELAGAACSLVHMDRLIEDPSGIASADLIGFAGGFSYGDDIAAGRVQAVRTRERLWAPLRAAAGRGVPMIGVCNGFQVLVQMGLLPGADGPLTETPPAPTVALAANAGDRFVDQWARMEIPPGSRCVWTRGLAERFGEEVLTFPSAHGEGRFVADDQTIARLEAGGQIAVRYAEGDNFNGSASRIAGICDPTGRIFGLMPHPERYLSWGHHPWATRLELAGDPGDTPGLALFRNAVEAVSSAGVPG